MADLAEILAYHYGQALELARAAGAKDQRSALEARAVRFLVLAGERALHLDMSKAGACFRAALDLLPPGAPERDRVLVKAGYVGSNRGLQAEAQRELEEAVEGFRDRGDARGVAEVLPVLSRVLWRRGDTSGARAAAQEAVHLLERETPSPELVAAYNEMARVSMLGSRPREAVEWADKTIELARSFGLDAQVARALDSRGPARVELGEPGGVDDLREALDLAQRLGLGYETVLAFGNLASVLSLTDGCGEALSVIQEGIRFADRRGLAFMSTWLRMDLSGLLYEVGEWDRALETADEVLEWSRGRGGGQLTVVAQINKAQVLTTRGDADQAGHLVDDFLATAREIADPQVLVPALLVAASVESARGRSDIAVDLVREFAALTTERPMWRLFDVAKAVPVLLSAGDGGAADLLEGQEPATFRDRCSLVTARAILAKAGDDPETALGLFEEAEALWAKFGHVVYRAEALLGAGRCLLALARSQEAAAKLREARDVFAGLGAGPLAADADLLLHRASGTVA